MTPLEQVQARTRAFAAALRTAADELEHDLTTDNRIDPVKRLRAWADGLDAISDGTPRP